MLQTQKQEFVEKEMKELTSEYQNDKLEFIRNPVVAEFLGLASNTDFKESDLEKSILTNLQKFLMELGKGYAFVARQQRIHTQKNKTTPGLLFSVSFIFQCFSQPFDFSFGIGKLLDLLSNSLIFLRIILL